MAITQGGLSAVDARIEVSLDGTTWTDISGSANKVDPGSAKRGVGTANVFDGDLPVVTTGKREPHEVTVSILYTETASESWEYIRPQFESHTRLYFRYAVVAGAPGHAVFTASNDGVNPGACIISELSWPSVDASSPDPVALEFKIYVPAFIRTTTGNSTGLGSGA